MPRQRHAVVLSILMALVASPVHATGSLDCSIDDKSASATIGAAVSRGFGETISSLRGEVTLKAKGLPADLPELNFAQEHLVHSWLRGRDIRLLLYRETEGDKPHASIELVIETRAARRDGTAGKGQYELTLGWVENGEAKTKVLRGNATCGAD